MAPARRRRRPLPSSREILEPAEHLPRAWAVNGTTGYDALALLGGLSIDSGAENAFTTLYRRLTADTLAFEAHAREGKRTVIRGSFGPEVRTLALALERIAEANRRSRDFTLASLHEAIVETSWRSESTERTRERTGRAAPTTISTSCER